jgi:hypothetical protein
MEWAREEHAVRYTGCERSGLPWFKTGIRKLKAIRKGYEKGRCLVCREEGGILHILLKCSKTNLREQFLSRKCLVFNEHIAYKRIINCNNAVDLPNIGKHLYEINLRE